MEDGKHTGHAGICGDVSWSYQSFQGGNVNDGDHPVTEDTCASVGC